MEHPGELQLAEPPVHLMEPHLAVPLVLPTAPPEVEPQALPTQLLAKATDPQQPELLVARLEGQLEESVPQVDHTEPLVLELAALDRATLTSRRRAADLVATAVEDRPMVTEHPAEEVATGDHLRLMDHPAQEVRRSTHC